MRNRQKGVTALGWLILLTPFAIVGYAAMRLTPVYLNYMKVSKAIDQAGNELKAGGINPQSIRAAIDKHFEIDMVEYPTTKDITVTRDGASWVIESKYDDDAPLFGNVSLHIVFDKKVRVGSSGTGD